MDKIKSQTQKGIEANISKEIAEALAGHKPERILFRESSFANDDALKVNISEFFRQKSPSTEIRVI